MAQYAIQKFTQKPLKPGERNIQASITDTRKYLPVAYGRVKLGLDIVFHAADPGSQQMYWYVGAIGIGEIEHVDALFFDNNKAAAWADTQSRYTEKAGALPPYAGYINTAAYLGKSAQNANTTLINLFPDSWDSDCKGNYIAYFLGSINLDAKIFPNGLPNDIGVVVKGVKVQDLRDESWPNAVPAYSTNPVLAILDYFIGKKDSRGNLIYGHGASPDEIDTASWIAAANYCDELVGTPVDDPEPPGVHVRNESGSLSANATYRYKIAYRDDSGYHTAASKKSKPVTTTDKKTAVRVVVQACEASTITKIDIYRNAAGGMTTFKLAGTIDNNTEAGELIWDDSVADSALGAAAPESNTTSTGGQQQKRFEIGGLVDNAESVKSNIEKMLTSCRGSIAYTRGQYSFLIRKAGNAVDFEITKDNIVGDWNFETPGITATCNQIKASFTNPKKKWDTDFVYWPKLRSDNKYLAEDSMQENEKTIDLLFTTNKTTARQIAQIIRKESRQGIRCSCICNFTAVVLRYGDIVPVTYDRLGWSQKKFWVTSVDYYPNATIGIGLEEYDATCYDDEAIGLDTSGSEDTDLPDINDPPDSVKHVVFLEALDTQGASHRIDLSVTYDNPTSPFWAYSNVFWKSEGDSRRMRFYKFDDNTTSYATDCGTDRADLTLQGGVSWVDGKFRYALQFDGESGCASAIPVVSEEITVSFWFYRNSVRVSSSDYLICNGDVSSEAGFVIYFPANSHELRFYLTTTDGTTKSPLSANYDMVASLDAWHHVCCTYNKSTGKQYLYIDNVLRYTQTHSLNNTIVPNSNPSLLVGAGIDAYYSDSILDSLAFYNEALEPDEIDNLYQNRPVYQDHRKTRHYKLNEGSGTLLYDSGMDKAIMTLHSGTAWDNGALSFDGVDDYAAADSIDSSEITVSFRFKRLAVATGHAGYLLNNRNETNDDGFRIYFDDNSHVLNFLLVTQDAEGNKTSGTVSFDMGDSTDDWHQVTATYDSVSGKQTLYMDGISRSYQIHPLGNTIVPSDNTEMQLGGGDEDDLSDGLELLFLFDETSGTNAFDDVTGTTKVSFNSCSWVAGKKNNAISLNGSQYGEFNDSSLFQWGKDDSFTISFWYKYGGDNGSAVQTIISRRDATGARWAFQTDSSNGKVYYFLRDTSGDDVDFEANVNAIDGSWHHIVFTRNGTTKDCEIWFDGVKKATQSKTYSYGFTTSEPVKVGVWAVSDFTAKGLIDNLRLYSRALDSAEINAIYTVENGGGGYYSKVLVKSFVAYSVALPDVDVYSLYNFDTYYLSANQYEFFGKIDKSNNNIFTVKDLQRFQTYHFKIQSFNTFGVAEDFFDLPVYTHTIGNTDPPEDIDPNSINITLTTINNVDHRLQASWIYNINTYLSDYVRDFRHFNVAISKTNSWADVILSDSTYSTWYSCMVPAGSWYFLVEAVDANGKTSNTTTLASKAFTVTDHDPETIVVGGGEPQWADIITGDFTTGTRGDTERVLYSGNNVLRLTQNMISNPSFGTNLNDWIVSGGTWVRSTAVYHSSPASLKRTPCDKSVKIYTNLSSPPSAGKKYIFSAWARSSQKNTDRIRMYLNYSPGVYTIYGGFEKEIPSNYHTGDSAWQRLDVKFVVIDYPLLSHYLYAETTKASPTGCFFDDFYFGVTAGSYTSPAYDRGNGAPDSLKVFRITTPTIYTNDDTEGKITISLGTSADDLVYSWYHGLESGAQTLTVKRYIRYRIEISDAGPGDLLYIKDNLKLSWCDPQTSVINFPAEFGWNTATSKASIAGNIDLTSGANVTIANTTADKNIALSTSGTGVVAVNGTNIGACLQVMAERTDPANSTTYYFGGQPVPLSTASGLTRLYIPVGGKIIAARICSWANGTAGSAQNWSLYIRLNDTSDTLIATTGVSAAIRTWVKTSLSIVVTAGDYIEIKCVTPNWGTPPTKVSFSGTIYITY